VLRWRLRIQLSSVVVGVQAFYIRSQKAQEEEKEEAQRKARLMTVIA
jgi:hypothetical protein